MNLFKLKINRNIKREKGGLTMVETLVAISILTIAVIGPLGIIAQALHTSYYTRDQMTAYYLAQETIEHVRNLRDDRGLEITKQYSDNGQDDTIQYPWLDGVVSTTTSSTIPQMTNAGAIGGLIRYSMERDSSGNYTFKSCPVNSGIPCDYMKIANGIYGVDSSTSGAKDSGFIREIYFQATDLVNPQEFKMVVNIYWRSGSYPSKLTLEERFTNWTSKIGS